MQLTESRLREIISNASLTCDDCATHDQLKKRAAKALKAQREPIENVLQIVGGTGLKTDGMTNDALFKRASVAIFLYNCAPLMIRVVVLQP